MKKLRKAALLIFTLSLVLSGVFPYQSASAGACAPGECAYKGMSEDRTGDYCYTGNGCPSYVCLDRNSGKTYDLTNNDCTREVCDPGLWVYPPSRPMPSTCESKWTEYKTKYCTIPICQTYCASYNYTSSCKTKYYKKYKYIWGYKIFAGWGSYQSCTYTKSGCKKWAQKNCRNKSFACGTEKIDRVSYYPCIEWYTPPPYQLGEKCYKVSDAKKLENSWNTCGKCDGYVPGPKCENPPCTGPKCTVSTWGRWSACSATCGGGTQTRTSNCGSTQSQACNEQACPPTMLNIEGIIWNATDKSCTANPNESDEITRGSSPGNVGSNISIVMDGTTSGTWNTNPSGRSYRISDVDAGEHTISVNVPDPVDYPNFKYRLVCVNDERKNSISVDAQASPTILHLGYNLASVGWFHVMDGDVFGGCTEDNCAYSISIGVPETTEGDFEATLLAGEGLVVGNSDLSVKKPDDSDAFTSEGNDYYATHVDGSTSYWPESFRFSAPSSAEDVSSCSDMFRGNLNAGEVYSASRDCVQDGIDDLGGSNYRISGNGVAVVYVEGDGTALSFEDNFRTSNRNQRKVMFITDGSVEFSSDIGNASPSTGTRSHVEASIIAEEDITFLTKGDGTDSTIIVDGPLVTKDGSINFNRDRGTSNSYPAQVVKYHPFYMIELAGVDGNSTQVFDVTWTIGN